MLRTYLFYFRFTNNPESKIEKYSTVIQFSTNFYNSVSIIWNVILHLSCKCHNIAKHVEAFLWNIVEHSWNYTVRKRRRDIRHDSHIRRTSLIFSSLETQLHRTLADHLISRRAIKQALAESTVSAKFACVEARHREREPAREWESSDRGGGWSRGGTRWTEEG